MLDTKVFPKRAICSLGKTSYRYLDVTSANIACLSAPRTSVHTLQAQALRAIYVSYRFLLVSYFFLGEHFGFHTAIIFNRKDPLPRIDTQFRALWLTFVAS